MPLKKTKIITLHQVTRVEEIWECVGLLEGDKRKLVDYSLGPAFRGCGYVACAKIDTDIVGLIWGVHCTDRDTLYIPYITISKAGSGLGIYPRLSRKLFEIAKADGFKYAFGLADPDHFASLKGMQRAGFKLVHAGKRFYYPDAQGCFYFIDLNDSSNSEPPKNSRFWSSVLSMEPIDIA